MTIEELNHTIETMIEKQDGKWCCNRCGKHSSFKANMKKHAEVHIEGVQHPCTACGKTYRSRNSLNSHQCNKLKKPANVYF